MIKKKDYRAATQLIIYRGAMITENYENFNRSEETYFHCKSCNYFTCQKLEKHSYLHNHKATNFKIFGL